jgi:hypothetical protein
MLWDRRAHQAAPVAENVLDFALAGGAATPRLLLLRSAAPAAGGRPLIDLAALDLVAAEETPLLAAIPQPDLLAIAAPGDRLAYVLTDGPSRVYTLEIAAGAAPKAAAVCTRPKDLLAGSPTPASAAPATPTVPPPTPEIASPVQPPSAADCTSLAWSPDGQNLAWSDARGLWVLEPGASRPRLAHDDRVQVRDPGGKTSLYAAALQDIRWSEDARFILLHVVPDAAVAGWDAVLDVRTGYLASLTDTFTPNPDEARAVWYTENSVMVSHSGDPLRQTAPFIHFWHVFATNPELLVPGQQFDLYSDDFPFSPGASKAIPVHALDWVTSQKAGKIMLTVKLPLTDARPVIFSLDTQTGKLSRLETLPLDVVQVSWSPDGSGALVSSAGGQFYFTTPVDGGLYDLEAVLPPDAARPVWLAPTMPRKTPR